MNNTLQKLANKFSRKLNLDNRDEFEFNPQHHEFEDEFDNEYSNNLDPEDHDLFDKIHEFHDESQLMSNKSNYGRSIPSFHTEVKTEDLSDIVKTMQMDIKRIILRIDDSKETGKPGKIIKHLLDCMTSLMGYLENLDDNNLNAEKITSITSTIKNKVGRDLILIKELCLHEMEELHLTGNGDDEGNQYNKLSVISRLIDKVSSLTKEFIKNVSEKTLHVKKRKSVWEWE